MKRKLSGLLALILAFGTTIGMTACGGAGPTPNTPDDLEIFYWNSGQGRDWLDNTIDAFVAKNPGVNVVKNFSENNTNWEKQLTSGASVNTIDLYINSMATMLAHTQYLEPLDDVMNEKDEKGVKFIDKYEPVLMDLLRKDGTLYGTYWGGGICGLVYNKTVFEEEEFEIPRTTDELADLAQDMVETKDEKGKSKNYTPFIFPGNADYWAYCYIPWAAQYGGIEELNAFWNPPATATSPVDKSVFVTEARRLALQTLEEVAYGYTYPASNEKTHTAAQTLFLNGTGLMMPNGNWIENEMKNLPAEDKIEFEFMKLPIISALGEKLELSDDPAEADLILREIVSYVDSADYANGTFNEGNGYDVDTVSGLDKAIIDRVAEARSIVYTEGTSNKAAIPNYANAKEWAKKFIKFMNTEEGLKYYWESMKGPMLAQISTERDTSTWSSFAQNVMTLAENSTFVYRAKGHPFFYNNGLEFYPEYPQSYLFPADDAERVTAAKFWTDKCLSRYNGADWDLWVQYSGLTLAQ